MNDAEFYALEAFAKSIAETCNTEELATRQLQSEGLVDENGLLAEPYREPICL